MRRARLLAGGILFLLVAVGLLVRQYLYMATWPEADAIVTGTRVIEEKSGPSGHPLYRSQVDVRYDLHGQAVAGHAVSTYWASDRAKAQDKLTRFVVGTHTKVRYDPSSPTDLRLDADLGFESLQMPMLAAMVGILLVAAWLLMGRLRHA
jgi:hypothetical protein